jgi:hypothetical protein
MEIFTIMLEMFISFDLFFVLKDGGGDLKLMMFPLSTFTISFEGGRGRFLRRSIHQSIKREK